MPKKITQVEFEKDVFNKLGSEYKVLDEYKGAHSKIILYHSKCGNIFSKNVHDIMTKGSGCPFCNGTKPSLYNEQWVIDNTPKGYLYIDGYAKMSEKCRFYCETCKSYFYQQPRRLITDKIYGCNCQPNKKLTNNDFLKVLGEDCLKEYEILEEYKGIDTKLKFRHKKCGTLFELSPYQFIKGHQKKYCPICYYKKSKGEIKINLFLEENNIPYQREFVFPGLNGFRFDFYLPELNTAIEYDGEQHFKAINFFGGEEGLQENQKRDKIKNEFCLKNSITLYRIPYWEENKLNIILTEIFKEKSSTTIEKYKVIEQSKEQAIGS